MNIESLRNYDLELDEFKHELLKQAITPSNKNKLFIIVEGISDKKLYEEFYTEDEVKFELVIGSEKNKNIEKIIELLSPESKQFIGIRDADFYHLEGTKPNCENVFLTDTHDSETLCFKSDSVIRKLIREFEVGMEINEFRSSCLQRIKFIGYARWYNYKNSLCLKFEKFPFQEIFKKDTLVFEKNRFIELLIQRSSKEIKNKINKEELLTEIEKLIDEKHDLFLLCNGHDLVSIIHKKINKETGKGVGEDEIERILRMNYTKEDFEKTSLCKSVMEKLKEFSLN